MDENDSVDEDDPELSCFCLVSSGDYYCQITESVSLIVFHVPALMQRIQLFIKASAGMPSRPAMIFLVQTSLHFGTIIWISSWSLSWCIPSGICATDLNFSGREYRSLWHLALILHIELASWGHWFYTQSSRLKATDLDEFQLRLKVSDPNLAIPVHSTVRWQFFGVWVFSRLVC